MENKRTWAVYADGGMTDLGQGRAVGGAIQPGSAYSLTLERDQQGRIVSRQERTGHGGEAWAYEYDQDGRLARVLRGGGLAESYQYDPQGRRSHEINAFRNNLNRPLRYDRDNRLLTAGNTVYEHDGNGFRSAKIESRPGQGERVTRYLYARDGRLLRADLPGGEVVAYEHDDQGRRTAALVNGLPVAFYTWLDRTRLLRAIVGGSVLEFLYSGGRTPEAMTRDGRFYTLHCDQVGSLRVVADEMGNAVKELVYDSFGNVLEDSNPGFQVPIGFAGGLADSDTGLIRFGYRDYDPDTGRFTAQDPIGYAGGDNDLYGYCLDDPVNLADAQGLWAEDIFSSIRDSTIWGYPPEERGKILGDYMKGELDDWAEGVQSIPDYSTIFKIYHNRRKKK